MSTMRDLNSALLRLRFSATVAAVLLLSACAQFQKGPVEIPDEGVQFLDIDGWRIRFETHGELGQPLVFLHGYGSSLSDWRGIIPSVCETNRCLLLDLPGFGWSDKLKGRYRPADLAVVVAKAMDEVGMQRAHIVAHSWGSAVALSLALGQPKRVLSLCLTGAWVYYDQLTSFFLWARAPGLGEALFTLFYDEQPELRYRAVFHKPDQHVKDEKIDRIRDVLDMPGFKRAALQAARDQNLETLETRYSSVHQETLLIWGREDKVSLPFYGHRLHGDLPYSRLELLPGTGHAPQIEAPRAWARLLLDHLQRQEGEL